MKKSGTTDAPARDVDSYLAALPPDVRIMLEELRRTILAAAPKAEELISYHMPTYKYHGVLLHFADFPNHCGLYAVGKANLTAFASELEGFKISGQTIHFSVEHPLPASLVKKIVKARMKENEARAKQ